MDNVIEVTIKTVPEFERNVKHLLKKYKSIYDVTLLTMYDKSEISNVTDDYKKSLLKQIE